MAFARSPAPRRRFQDRRARGQSRPAAVPALRRKVGGCACGGGCPRCDTSARTAGANLTAGVANLETGGEPLVASERDYFEPRFGRDFSNVRLHSDGRAAALAQEADAEAFTAGRHIVLGARAARRAVSDRRPLIAHELAHTVQQDSAPAQQAPTIQRFKADECADSGCQPPSRCDTVEADFDRAMGYLDDATAALGTDPLAEFTQQALRWYFHRDNDTPEGLIGKRLGRTRTVLNMAKVVADFLCHSNKDCPSRALAYVNTSTSPDRADYGTIHLCDRYFGKNDRKRAETLIHEASHLIGMSVSTDDVYEHSIRFRSLKPEEAILNADSFALFASAIDRGSIGISLVITEGVGGGAVLGGPAGEGWAASFFVDTTVQHPVLHVFNPSLRMSMSIAGVPESGDERTQSDTSLMLGVLPGLRIEDPRPDGGNFGLSLFGGPTVNFRTGLGGSETAIGAQAGIGVGYRWQWLDLGADATYMRDPTAAPDARNLVQVGATIGFNFGAGSP